MSKKPRLSSSSVMFMMLVLVGMLVALLGLNTRTMMAENADVVAQGQTERQLPAHLQEVPAEIQELFADGISVEEFVQMTGYVPRALEGLVEGDALMIIELKDEPVSVRYAQQRDAGQLMTHASIENYIQALEAAQAELQPQIEALGVQIISNYTIVYNGFQVLTPLNRLNEIRELPGVVAVHRAPIHEPALGASVDLIGAPGVWENFGYDGEDIVIAIIDTGIDYTHAALGGSGDPQDYIDIDPDVVEPGTFPTAKVIAGYDFAGTLYHAGCSAANEAAGICTRIPQPDPNPLDEHGHGTHVAATAAGIAAGDVLTGTAPGATLMALKVFGQSGSTALTIDALEMATHSYLLYGYPQVINMSLGSNFGTDDPNDPSVYGTQNAAAAGIVVVASAGNAGNNSYITGSPATADKAISVAASTTGYVTGPTINISGTAYVTQTNIIYTPASFDDNTGHYTETTSAPLAYVANLSGATDNLLCSTDTITPTNALAGQIALIQRGACAFSDKVDNAADLGAVGAIIYNNAPGVFGMAGTPVTIPAVSVQMPDGEHLVPAHGEIVVVSAVDEVVTVPNPYTPADEIATFSSRGPRGYDSALKPEITAPGVAIFAASMGGGTTGQSMSGTSMAAPHVAGVAALMLQANPDWMPEAVKAAMMNTTVPLSDGTTIPRAGAGRINAYRAVTTTVYAVGDDDLVSLNWGVIMSRNDSVTRVGHVTLYNEGSSAEVFTSTVGFQTGSMMAGAVVSVEPLTVTVPAESSAVVTVTLELDMTEIPVIYGPGGVEEYYGFVNFTPPGGDPTDTLVVPFYFQPRPYSQLEEIVASNVITDPGNDVATFELTHRGPITSSLWAYPALIWNDMPNPAMAGPGDVRMFGMDYGWTDASFGDIIAVGINAWDYWHVPQPFFAEFDLYIDANQDGDWDFVNFNYNLGWWQGAGHNNFWLVIQVDLAAGMLYLGSPSLIYTDYNASYMEWYLPAAWQGVGPANSTFDYMLLGFDAGGMDMNPPGSFDYARSPFDFTISNNPGPAERDAELWVGINDLAGYLYSQPHGVMIVDYNGDPRNNNGAQAYFEPIELGPLPFRSYLPFILQD